MDLWMPIPGYEGYYSVSEGGIVRSEDRVVPHIRDGKRRKGQIIKSRINRKTGYPAVNLCYKNKMKTYPVHKLVSMSFLGPRPSGMEVCHIDGDRKNARLSNLRYGTSKENSEDILRHGTVARGERLARSFLKEADILAIRADTRLQREIAAQYGVGVSAISNIKNLTTWRHVK